jgi:hypothetical protein
MSGSKGARASPDLIAACHVLHRLSSPRHPSEALSRLIVLSRTHARTTPPGGKRRQADIEDPHLGSLQSDDVFIRAGPKADAPFLHHVNHKTPPSRSRLRQASCETWMRSLCPAGGCAGGGARRVRTDDLMLAKHALYQLSYGPDGEGLGLRS